MVLKRIKWSVLVVLSLFVSACGGGDHRAQNASASSSLQTDASGVTMTTVAVGLDKAAATFPAGTTLKAVDGSAVTGQINVTMKYGTSASDFSGELGTSLSSKGALRAYVEIDATGPGGTVVKTINAPIPVTLEVPLADGTTVEIYSNSRERGGTWVLDSTTKVTMGKVTFTVSHFQIHAIVQKTGSYGGSGTT